MRALALFLIPTAALAGGPAVTVDGLCPGPVDLEIMGVTPGSTVAILKGDGPGSDLIPGGPCAGIRSGLDGLAYVTSLRDSDGDGMIRLRPSLPAPACSQSIQVIDVEGCVVSTVTPLGRPSCGALAPSYPAVDEVVDAGALVGTIMTTAWDGTALHMSSGGGAIDTRLTRYAADGTFLGNYAPGLDVRSVFTMGDGIAPTYIRPYGSSDIYRETAPGSYTFDRSLGGGTLDAQSAVVWDATRERFLAMEGGQVDQWDAAGMHLGSVMLSGYVDPGYPANRGIAVSNAGCWMTYDDGVVTTWGPDGERLGSTLLSGAGVDFNALFSFSYAAGRVWVWSDASSSWSAFDLGL